MWIGKSTLWIAFRKVSRLLLSGERRQGLARKTAAVEEPLLHRSMAPYCDRNFEQFQRDSQSGACRTLRWRSHSSIAQPRNLRVHRKTQGITKATCSGGAPKTSQLRWKSRSSIALPSSSGKLPSAVELGFVLHLASSPYLLHLGSENFVSGKKAERSMEPRCSE